MLQRDGADVSIVELKAQLVFRFGPAPLDQATPSNE
jgi:hypothetical protein